MVPHVTVIVCTRDRPRQLEACLAAVAGQQYPSHDVLVVDNGSTDPASEICRARGVACIRERVPGLTRARNLGARAARGDIVAYIDDDAIAEPGWIGALVREFEDPGVAATAGRTRYMKADGDSLRMTDEEAPGEPPARPHGRFDRSTPEWFSQACFGRIGDGNTMAFRRTLLTSAVRFDERIGRGRVIDGGDEHVAFMSLISDGYRVTHTPDAVVRHPSPSSDGPRRAKRLRDLRSSLAYLIFLWFQFPGHRGDIVRFLRRACLRRLPGRPTTAAAAGLSLSQVLAAVFSSIHTYWRARLEWAPGADHSDVAMPRVVTLR